MRARVRFLAQPFFTSLPNKLVCPGTLVGRSEGRAMWTMVFVADKQVSATIFEGDLTWLLAPAEQDFGKGVRFKLMSRPGNKRRLDGVEHDPHPEHDKPDKEPKGKGKNPAAFARKLADEEEDNKKRFKGAKKDDKAKPPPGPPPGHPPKPHPDPDEVNPDLPLLRARDFGTRPPVPGIFAEGELLG